MQILSDAEWKIMNVAWRRGAVTARDVLDEIGDDTAWAYTTVKTMMTRLVEKGALRVSDEGKASVYEALLTRNQARVHAVRSLIDRAFDGATAPMVRFLLDSDRLSKRDRAELARLLEAQDDTARATRRRRDDRSR